MKKLFLIGTCVALVSFVGLAFAYSPSSLFEPKSFCVKMRDAKAGRMVNITIQANGQAEAIRNAKSMYPNLTYSGISQGACK